MKTPDQTPEEEAPPQPDRDFEVVYNEVGQLDRPVETWPVKAVNPAAALVKFFEDRDSAHIFKVREIKSGKGV